MYVRCLNEATARMASKTGRGETTWEQQYDATDMILRTSSQNFTRLHNAQLNSDRPPQQKVEIWIEYRLGIIRLVMVTIIKWKLSCWPKILICVYTHIHSQGRIIRRRNRPRNHISFTVSSNTPRIRRSENYSPLTDREDEQVLRRYETRENNQNSEIKFENKAWKSEKKKREMKKQPLKCYNSRLFKTANNLFHHWIEFLSSKFLPPHKKVSVFW